MSLQTAALDDELHAQKGFVYSEILMRDSVSLLRMKVQDPSQAFQDATMNAVVTLAAIEVCTILSFSMGSKADYSEARKGQSSHEQDTH